MTDGINTDTKIDRDLRAISEEEADINNGNDAAGSNGTDRTEIDTEYVIDKDRRAQLD